MSQIIVVLDGKQYIWNGKQWFGPDYLQPPEAILAELDRLAAEQFDAKDATIGDLQGLLDAAKAAQEADQHARALKLAQRALALESSHHGAASVVCSILREMGQPAKALELADGFVAAGSKYPPLLTSRAAALCDLKRWDEALRQIRHVFAICGGKGDGEALSVWGRIKAAAPELF